MIENATLAHSNELHRAHGIKAPFRTATIGQRRATGGFMDIPRSLHADAAPRLVLP